MKKSVNYERGVGHSSHFCMNLILLQPWTTSI